MLKELTIKNFTSFNNEVTFSMEADTDRVSEHPEHIVEINDNKLLRVASVYGPNGGGKSNLLKALTVIVLLMLIDFGMYKFIGVSLVNLLQDIIYAINMFLDKIQSWYL